MSRLLHPGAEMRTPGSTVIWPVGLDCTSAVLPAWASPTWIFCLPTIMAPRTDTPLITVSGTGRGAAMPKRRGLRAAQAELRQGPGRRRPGGTCYDPGRADSV